MVFVSTSCFDEVSLAEIVLSGSQHILTDLILLFLHFCFMTLFQDNHKLGTFCLMSSWMAFRWIFTSSCFRNSSGYVFF